jgi:mannosylglycerate hydrolase MGH1-like protein
MAQDKTAGVEEARMADDAARKANWKRWGPYLSERQWGTVREDYSADGSCWSSFPHDQARSRAYRWGEDGLLGITDRECRLCFSLALWNEKDPILKERLFGLTGPEGNHGEDVKEEYYYLDSTPTHSYMKGLYKYPQGEFPYRWLVEENRRRTRKDPEFELVDTGVFRDDRYFDVFVEYAKKSPNDILIKITAANRGSEPAPLHLLPTVWCRNCWTWGNLHEEWRARPELSKNGKTSVRIEHESLGVWRFEAEEAPAGTTREPRVLFTENETNLQAVFGAANANPFNKDSFHRFVIHGDEAAVNPSDVGTKAAVYYVMEIPPGESVTILCRLYAEDEAPHRAFGGEFDSVFRDRIAEADEFYDGHISTALHEDDRRIARQGYAGLLWSKQFYYYVVEDWLDGDPLQPPPPKSRENGRNKDWRHLFNRDVISMPDKWEYPWYASWDLAFHMITFAKIDPDFAKEQLILLLREWYMHPNGQLPAYEFEFGDVNPPVHAFACWRVYKMTGPRGQRDRGFLARCFQKLMINFTWWVNRKDISGKNIFGGGFLGLDNIGVFDRSKPLPTGGTLDQADGTAWMAFFCAQMLGIAIELAQDDPVYEDVASKFFEHFVAIADAMNTVGGTGLWDEQDGFYYDMLCMNGQTTPLRVRSLVGLIPLFAAEVLDEESISKLTGFRKRMDWFLHHRRDLAHNIAYMSKSYDFQTHDKGEDTKYAAGARNRFLLAIPSKDRLQRVLQYLLDENEFLSTYGVRSLSRHHLEFPYVLKCDGKQYEVKYVPAESDTELFGGNSNWRGPIWLPVNFLIVEALERYSLFYGPDFKVECPTGSGNMMDLQAVGDEIFTRLMKIFQRDANGHRPVNGGDQRYASDPNWKDLVLFYEYFHGDNGRGVGASHQTGWTALVARIMAARGRRVEREESAASAASAAAASAAGRRRSRVASGSK